MILIPLLQYKLNIVNIDPKNLERELLIDLCPGGEIPIIYIESTDWFWDGAYEATLIERETTPICQNEEDKTRPNG